MARLEEGTDALVWDAEDCARHSVHASHTVNLIRVLSPALGVCVQAGGHRGLWPLALSQFFTQVFTFEAHPRNFQFLQVIAQQDNVMAYRAALGDIVRMVTLEPGNPERITHSGYCIRETPGDIPMIRVDDLPLTALDALVLDIEGAELLALKGAEQSIVQYKPLIVVERNPSFSARFGYTFDDLEAWVQAHGYSPSQQLYNKDVYYKPL